MENDAIEGSSGAKPRYVRVLSIAGSDSGGGAGIQADLKTFAALGCYGMTAITAVTAQNTLGVRAIHVIPPRVLMAQIEAVLDDIGADAIKIGMLPTREAVQVVVKIIDKYRVQNVVLDPVMVATSGDRLVDDETARVMLSDLFPRVTVVTPNLDEAGWLLQRSIHSPEDMLMAGAKLVELGARAALVKGAHLPGPLVSDVLCAVGIPSIDWHTERVGTHNTHGTGCTLSSAIAAYMARGLSLNDAVSEARAYVLNALKTGAATYTGSGHGPLNHGFEPQSAIRRHQY
jgi:hydroxymethylpyrimidine/phosphomethylpyrimidine kinase